MLKCKKYEQKFVLLNSRKTFDFTKRIARAFEWLNVAERIDISSSAYVSMYSTSTNVPTGSQRD